jgi:hypothetical protein
MKTRSAGLVVLFPAVLGIAAAASLAGQSAAPPSKPMPSTTPAVAARLEAQDDVWQVDLVPTGTGFAVTKPVLEGNVYVFRVWPDRDLIRLPKARVKNMVRRTNDVGKELVYRIDLLPTGQMYSRDEPVLKGTTYQFHRWAGNTLLSARQTDVKKITKISGADAFRLYLELFGAKPIGNLAMEGPRSSPQDNQPSGAASAFSGDQGLPPGNWIYQGVPGVTDAWAPPSAVVAYPGDVPKAPQPR